MLNPRRVTELTAIRTTLGLSQTAMAHLLELSTQEYEALERGECEVPNHYILAAERAAMTYAVLHNAPTKAPSTLREEAIALVQLTEAPIQADMAA